MNGIQAILISGVILISFYYALKLRSAFLDLVILTACSLGAIFFILFPSYTNVLAHKMGVGRGADLLFYLCILLFLFIILKLFARIRRLEKQFIELVRQEATREAKLPDEKEA